MVEDSRIGLYSKTSLKRMHLGLEAWILQRLPIPLSQKDSGTIFKNHLKLIVEGPGICLYSNSHIDIKIWKVTLEHISLGNQLIIKTKRKPLIIKPYEWNNSLLQRLVNILIKKPA